MRIVMFYHSLVSDWNHGNAHFLRGLVSEFLRRGMDVSVYEPSDGWSRRNLILQHGTAAVEHFHRAYPWLESRTYDLRRLDIDAALDHAQLVLVHEWNDPELVRRIGEHRACVGGYRLLFHDTHHRAVTEPRKLRRYDLRNYDGVLAYGAVIRDVYLDNGWAAQAWTWHEAADTYRFRPLPRHRRDGDLVWIGNWGDGERTAELYRFLVRPVQRLGLRARAHGVRYPELVRRRLARAGIDYRGWVSNLAVPRVFSHFDVTVHIPRRPYVHKLPGIPTIRVFEALACAIPLVCSPWEDAEGLFTPGLDYLVARTGDEMRSKLRSLVHDRDLARTLGRHGLRTIHQRHTCAHRVDELFKIVDSLKRKRIERVVAS